jgi:DMSO/TMAO reductase YedYZ molybdopterin-dependent catalytic subunit
MSTLNKRASIPGGFGAGVGAALVMMLVMAVLRLTTNTISIPELMEESLIRLAGGRVEAFFINRLGVGGKALLLVTIVEGTLLLGGLLGLLFTRYWPAAGRLGRSRWLSGLLFGLLVGLFLNAVFLPLVNQGFFGSTALQATAPPGIARALYGSEFAPFGLPVFLNMFLLSVVFGLALVALLPWRRAVAGGEPELAPQTVEGQAATRRDFVKALGGGALALVGGVALWGAIREALAAPPQAGLGTVDGGSESEVLHDVPLKPTPEMTEVPSASSGAASFGNVKPMLVPEVTPVENFYITTKNFIDPTVDGNSWKLNFKGMVDNPYSITLKDLQAMPAIERDETLSCISNPIGGSLIGNGQWKGVDFAPLVEKAKPREGVYDVVVRGADGYSDSFPLKVALENECVLVYEQNGKPLTQKHGYPARLLVPGIYGMKNCKWITDVEFVDSDYKGYWESQGWSDEAHYQTLSRIDFPDQESIPAKPVYITGIAWAGNRGIKRVEVTTDGGKTWHDADLRPTLGKHSWTLWTYPWQATPGDYTLQARATDGTGAVQDAEVRDTFPDGATGYHTRRVRVS